MSACPVRMPSPPSSATISVLDAEFNMCQINIEQVIFSPHKQFLFFFLRSKDFSGKLGKPHFLTLFNLFCRNLLRNSESELFNVLQAATLNIITLGKISVSKTGDGKLIPLPRRPP